MGRKCLIIDLDANQGSTRHLGVPSTSFLGTYEVLIGEEQPSDVIITNGEDDVEIPKNVDLIPASRKLESIEEALRQHSKFIVEQDILIKPLQHPSGPVRLHLPRYRPERERPHGGRIQGGPVVHPGGHALPVRNRWPQRRPHRHPRRPEQREPGFGGSRSCLWPGWMGDVRGWPPP